MQRNVLGIRMIWMYLAQLSSSWKFVLKFHHFAIFEVTILWSPRSWRKEVLEAGYLFTGSRAKAPWQQSDSTDSGLGIKPKSEQLYSKETKGMEIRGAAAIRRLPNDLRFGCSPKCKIRSGGSTIPALFWWNWKSFKGRKKGVFGWRNCFRFYVVVLVLGTRHGSKSYFIAFRGHMGRPNSAHWRQPSKAQNRHSKDQHFNSKRAFSFTFYFSWLHFGASNCNPFCSIVSFI